MRIQHETEIEENKKMDRNYKSKKVTDSTNTNLPEPETITDTPSAEMTQIAGIQFTKPTNDVVAIPLPELHETEEIQPDLVLIESGFECIFRMRSDFRVSNCSCFFSLNLSCILSFQPFV